MKKGVFWAGIILLILGIILYFVDAASTTGIIVALVGLIVTVVGLSPKPRKAPRQAKRTARRKRRK